MYSAKPHIVNAVIGNRKMLAVMSYNGKMERLWWPRMDEFQQLDEWSFALTLEGHSNILWLHDEGEWDYSQNYLDDMPIVRTQGKHKVLPICWEFTDFILPNLDCLIRKIRIKNMSSNPIRIKLWQYTNFYIDERIRYNTTEYLKDIDTIFHYRANTTIGICSSLKTSAFQCGNNAKEQILYLSLECDRQEMTSDGALMWELGYLNGHDYIENVIYLVADTSIDTVTQSIDYVKNHSIDELEMKTFKYWNNIYQRSRDLPLSDEKLKTLYLRSIMVFHLLSHVDLGGILAAPEVDEDFQYCGGYGFCWGRDAAYITNAIDIAGYPDLVEKFYKWAAVAQNADGSWSQRHYLDGTLAPNWGLQIDETGSILWGIWEHYKITGDKSFLSNMWPTVEKGANYLTKSIDEVTGLPLESYDLWEERVGKHTYSSAAVYGGLMGASKVAKKLGFTDQELQWEEEACGIKESIERWCWDGDENRFLRGIRLNTRDGKLYKDYIVDVSLIGLVYPFEVIDPYDERAISTAQTIYDRLMSPKIGGIKRYEDDIYRGGNPWILTTLWLSYYYILIDDMDRAQSLFDWAVAHVTEMDLFPEQIHRNTGEPAWVVPLTWSHAMFILVLDKLLDSGILYK